jgi:hypothetical protein
MKMKSLEINGQRNPVLTQRARAVACVAAANSHPRTRSCHIVTRLVLGWQCLLWLLSTNIVLSMPRHTAVMRLNIHNSSAFLACSRNFGAVPALFSISAAHSAAPTVFVNAKIRLANGTISRTKAATPNLREELALTTQASK